MLFSLCTAPLELQTSVAAHGSRRQPARARARRKPRRSRRQPRTRRYQDARRWGMVLGASWRSAPRHFTAMTCRGIEANPLVTTSPVITPVETKFAPRSCAPPPSDCEFNRIPYERLTCWDATDLLITLVCEPYRDATDLHHTTDLLSCNQTYQCNQLTSHNRTNLLPTQATFTIYFTDANDLLPQLTIPTPYFHNLLYRCEQPEHNLLSQLTTPTTYFHNLLYQRLTFTIYYRRERVDLPSQITTPTQTTYLHKLLAADKSRLCLLCVH